MKLKAKLTGLESKTRLVFIFGMFLALAGSFLMSAKQAKADYLASDISVKVDTLINGQPNNFARVGKDGTLNIEVDITLLTPSQLKLGGTPAHSDLLDTNATFVANRSIDGFGAGALPNPYTSDFGCNSQVLKNLLNIQNSQMQVCKSVDGTDVVDNSARTVTQGNFVLKKTISISGSQFQALGITSTSDVNKFYIYPYLVFDNLPNSAMSAFLTAVGTALSPASSIYSMITNRAQINLAYMPAQNFYVQLYDTQAQANADAGQNKPSGVPDYGSVTATSQTGSSSPIAGFLSEIIGVLLGLVQELIYAIFSFLIAPIIQAMLAIQTYKDNFVAVIYPGWIVIRNLCDIMFIVALIVIAMATLFRLESYQYKHLLVQLILAALLINFSLVIGQVVLAIADTVQAQFLPPNVTVIKSLAGDLMVNNWRSTFLSNGLQQLFNGSFSDIVIPIFYLALSLGSFMVFVAIAAFLFIRIIALWILLMISPVAYACGILPATAHYREEWWKTFLKYAFFTPVMAFFLNMAAIMSNTYRTTPILQQVNSQALQASLGNSSIATFVFKVGSNILLLIFLLAGLMVAEKFSIYGAKEVSGFAKKYGVMAPFGAAQWGAGRGLSYLNRKRKEVGASMLEQEGEHMPGFWKKMGFTALNPDVIYKGWKARSEELQHQAEGVATAGGRELVERRLTGGKLNIPYRQYAERKDENELSKDYSTMRKESLMAAAVDAEKLGGEEGKRRRRAIVLAAAKQGYLDDLLRKKHFANQFADKDGTFYSAEVLNRFLYKYLGDDEQAQRLMAEDLEELGKGTGHFEYLGHAYFDNQDKKFKRGMTKVGSETITRDGKQFTVEKLKNDWQVGYAVGELKKISGRLRAQIAPHNIVTLRAKKKAGSDDFDFGDEIKEQIYGREPGGVGLDEFQRGVLSMFDGATLQQASFAQGRTKEWSLSENIDKNTGEVIVKNDADVQRIKDLYQENPDLVRSMYGQLMNVQPYEVKGIKVVKLDVTGKSVPVVDLGDTTVTVTPVIKTVATEILDSKTLGLDKKATDALRDGKVIDNAIAAAYTGSKTQAQIETDLNAAFTRAGVTTANATVVKDEIFAKIKAEYKEKYNPMTVISRLDEQYKLTPVEISELRKEFQTAAADAFGSPAATARGRVDRVDFNVAVRGKIAAVAGRLGTDSKVAKVFTDPHNPAAAANLAAAEKLFIDHMTPV